MCDVCGVMCAVQDLYDLGGAGGKVRQKEDDDDDDDEEAGADGQAGKKKPKPKPAPTQQHTSAAFDEFEEEDMLYDLGGRWMWMGVCVHCSHVAQGLSSRRAIWTWPTARRSEWMSET